MNLIMIRAQYKLKVPQAEVKSSRDVFALFVALNSLGYNEENNSLGMTPTRQKIRLVFQRDVLEERYPTLIRAIRKNHPWQLLYKILTVTPLYPSRGFVVDIRRFSCEPKIKRAWKDTKAAHLQEAQKAALAFKHELLWLTMFLNREPRRFKKMILVVNPLDAYWRGYALKIKSTGYVITGPGATDNNNELIRHELLHLLAPFFRLPKDFVAHRSSSDNSCYTGYKVVNRECVICALSLLYQRYVFNKNINLILRRKRKEFPFIEKAVEYLEKKINPVRN